MEDTILAFESEFASVPDKTEKTATARRGDSSQQRLSLAQYEELLSKNLKPRDEIPEEELAWVKKTLFEKLA